MATPQVKDLVLRSPAGSSEVITFSWPLQIGSGQDKHDNGIDIIDTIKFVCDELPGISSAFEEINLNQIDTACYKTMTNLVDRFNKAVDSIVALEKGTSLPAERLNKFAHPSLLRHILQLVYNAAVLDPDKLNNYEPFSPEVYGETSYELVQQMIKHVNVSNDDTFIDLGSGVGQVVLQMAGSFPLKTCIGIEKADTPARYAERMDTFFRQFMAWFGKRYCEYKLLKGDFLVDEHREKITTSSLVFVNNFAFGPNVDHQLKERFADLRDGARVVSSKSFCPLNFRITDRNLSDIGTIMHVSEIPPLKGSVSWTCKPVSYYLHVIDRTILERYFQRLKTQKGAENDHHVGSTRTTRDRAKREANNQALNHSNSNSNSATTNRTNSPANVHNHIAVAAVSKTRQQQQHQQQLQQQQQQQQQQRSMDMDSSTESDGDGASIEASIGVSVNAAATTNGTANAINGTAVIAVGNVAGKGKVWSDWCSSKGKSSQSDDEEENNNFSSTTNSRQARATTQKKRKKLTRKAAIASKSAAAAQREAAAREREAAAAAAAIAAATAATNKETSSKEDNAASNGPVGKGRKGRLKKGPGRGRKSLKIVGLDVLHKQTLLSTSVEVMSKKLPPAPGTVDQQLTALLTGDMSHTELNIPEAPQDTPYALQILLDVFRAQYMSMIDQMKSKAFIPNIKRQIQLEQERKQRIKNRASQLDKQIKVLIDDSVALLKIRMNELGINVSSPNDLIAKAKEIVGRHKELQGIAKKIQSQVNTCEVEKKRVLKAHLAHLPDYQKFCIGGGGGLGSGTNGKTKLELLPPLSVTTNPHDLSEVAAHELVLKEIANTLAQRKKLYAQVSSIEKEAAILEKASEERRTAAALLAQGTNMTLANVATTTTTLAPPTSGSGKQDMMPATIIAATTAQQPLQLTTTIYPNSVAASIVPTSVGSTSTLSVKSNGSGHAKSSRRSRDHRTRSQEWPDVPDVGKIDESNPEVLAQKILETGRQIEAGKFTATTVGGSNYANAKQQTSHPQHHYHNSIHHHPNNNMSSQHQHEEKRATGSNKPHQRSSSSEYANMPSIYMGPQDSTLMPAPAATKSQQAALLLNSSNISAAATAPASVGMSSQQPQQQPPSSNSMRGSSILPKCELPGSRNNKASSANGAANSSSSAIQESPKVANFEDRLKSIITSALNEDQEHRKAVAHQMPTSGGGGGMHNEPNGSAAAASSPQQSPAPKRSKQSAASANQHLPPPQQHQHQQAAPQNINNIINVATQGLTHLNATTTISPITPPLAVSNQYVGGNYVASKYGGATKESKYHHHAVPPPLPLPTQQQQQHYSNASEWKTSHQQDHRRRSSISAASYEQHFAALAQQQQQHHAMMMAAAAHSAHHQPQPNAAHHHGISSSASTAAVAAAHHNMLAMEFKAPTSAENLLAAAQRSNSRELLLDDASVQAPRSASANSDSALMYYPPTRDRLMSLERSISRESAVSQPLQMQQHQQHQSLQPSRPNSNSSQPDYTQVSPAKMALRRHLSQEKLNQQLPPAASGMLPLPSSSKTIGDLVNGEIERTLEISHQSIINAVVNMSTVGSATAGGTNATASVAASERQYLERSIYDRPPPSAASSSSTNERLLINPNAQRPERVHVRVLEEQSAAHNLATLVHVAYNNKTASGSEMGGGIASSITTKLSAGGATTAAATSSTSSSTTTANAAARYSNSRDAFNHLSVAAAAAVSGRTSSASVAAASSSLSYASARGGRADYQTVPLPRAEMKGCIEAYFSEEQHFQHQHAQPPPQQQQQQQQPQSHQHKSSSSSKDRSSARSSRMNGGNAPLEGLAASLQDRVMASRKYKEEHEERQRRAAVAAAAAANNSELHNHSHQQQQHQEQQQHAASQHFGNNHHGHHHQPHQHHQQHHPTQHYQAGSSNSTHNHNNGSPIKVEIGIKRTSPSAANQPRPSKIAHYAHEPQNHQLQQLQQHPQPSYQHHHMTSTSMMASSSSSSSSSGGHNNPYATTNGGGLHMHAAAHSSPTSTSSASRRHKLPLEPLLMSPEINSIMGDHERPTQLSSSSRQLQHHQQQQQQQTNNTTTSSSSSSTTPIAGGRAGDDDDVIADDESHWQHRVSSGFDRLVAFASTELDKTRRSIDTDTVPSSISCNTSPDSGITHSSSCNSDAARTFLSTSSTCSSQLELLPIGCSGGGGGGSTSSSTSSSGGGGYMQHQSQAHHNLLHHHASCSETLIDGGGSLKSLHSNKKTTCSVSPMDPSALESPPLSDIGMPRTPSPTNAAAAVPTPPLVAPAIAQPDTSTTTTTTLKIPLKYQRKSKSSSSSSEKHYKKKFCERNWEYDCDELMAYSNSSSTTAADAAGNAPPPATSTTTGSTNNASARQEHVPSSSSQKLSGKSPKEVTVADHHNYGSTSSNHQSSSSTAAGSAATSSSASAHYHHHHHHHKSSKFRPKGKDWDWSLDSSGSSTGVGGAKSKVADVVAVVSTAASSATTTTTTTNVN